MDLPTTPNPLVGKEFIASAAKEMGLPPKYRVLSRPMVRIFGWFNPMVGEVYEMLYQNDAPYLFDSSNSRELSVLRERPTPRDSPYSRVLS